MWQKKKAFCCLEYSKFDLGPFPMQVISNKWPRAFFVAWSRYVQPYLLNLSSRKSIVMGCRKRYLDWGEVPVLFSVQPIRSKSILKRYTACLCAVTRWEYPELGKMSPRLYGQNIQCVWTWRACVSSIRQNNRIRCLSFKVILPCVHLWLEKIYWYWKTLNQELFIQIVCTEGK